MGVPADHLCAIWRLEPNHGSGIFCVALDPREAEFVLERGWATLDGVRYRVNLKGWTGKVDGDGRVSVRCEVDDEVGVRRLARDRNAKPTGSSSPPVSVLDWWSKFEVAS